MDHSTIEYQPFRKNLYIVPRAIANLTPEQVAERREVLTVKVRGKQCPAPVETWGQCGLSERMLKVIEKYKLERPFAIQCQAMPAIMAGRDVLAVAKTGSGKTLAFLLPMLRHVLDQPPLARDDGPIGLIIAPARELAVQIFKEAKKFTKMLGLRVACAYGGAGIGEQITDLKRGAEICVCTPGRLIDILYHCGKVTNLRRTTMVVMDEADRMFDMGFEPQVNLICQNVRPDRQVVLFSATFPKAIEQLARKTLRYPLEVVVGERSVVNKDITQFVEVRTENKKFFRLLQILGVQYDRGSTLIFVDKQEKCDDLFSELTKAGYPSLSLHGGIEQMDRDHTLQEFKTLQKKVMVATSVAGRGLDVPECVCVVNYNCPNHLEDYVHRVGRTGRAGRKGTSYTFVTPDEEAFTPYLEKVLVKAGAPVPADVKELLDAFNAKVEAGDARRQKSTVGFTGKGYSFDPTELTNAQKKEAAAKRAYELAQGIAVASTAGEDEDDVPDEELLHLQQQPSSSTSSSSSSSSSAMSLELPTSAAQMRARILASQMSVTNNKSGLASAPTMEVTFGGSRIKELEIDINDYAVSARRKVTAKSTIENIFNKTSVNIISRGTYQKTDDRHRHKVDLAEQQRLPLEKRRLHLLLQGPGDHEVQAARHAIQAILDAEELRASTAADKASASSGRYKVVQ